jgi:serine/threonine protein kinase
MARQSKTRTVPCPGREQWRKIVESLATLPADSPWILHLDGCEKCRQILEEAAAEPDFWIAAKRCLQAAPPEGVPDFAQLAKTLCNQALETLPSPPAVGPLSLSFLKPSNKPDCLGTLDRYEVHEVLGWGGMGLVLKAYDPTLQRTIALKVLASLLTRSPQARTRFQREARSVAAVRSPHVVAIYEIQERAELPYLAMEYVPGRSLQQRMDSDGPFDLEEIVRIGLETAQGLAAAHAQGLVHRDVKPGNILLEEGTGRVKLTDFGLARAVEDTNLTHSCAIAGTPLYMAPEQVRGEPLDGRCDLFSLGSVLYALGSGRQAFQSDTAFGVLRRVMESVPEPIRDAAPEIPLWFCRIVEKLHAKNPADRFPSAGELADLLDRWLAHLRQPALIPPPEIIKERRSHKSKIRKISLSLSAGIAVVCAAALAINGFNRSSTEENKIHNTQTVHSAPTAAELKQLAEIKSLLSAQALLPQESKTIQDRIRRIEADWSRSPQPGDDWNARVIELHRRIDDLSRRIDRNSP